MTAPARAATLRAVAVALLDLPCARDRKGYLAGWAGRLSAQAWAAAERADPGGRLRAVRGEVARLTGRSPATGAGLREIVIVPVDFTCTA